MCEPRPLQVNSRARRRPVTQSARLHRERLAQVLVRGRLVANVQADGLADTDRLADRDRPRFLIGADYRSDQEVPRRYSGLFSSITSPSITPPAQAPARAREARRSPR